jgi:hypothetical protein
VSILSINVPGHSLFRGTVLIFAFVLGCQATWILIAELSRPPSSGFPRTVQAAAAAVAHRNAAARAASFGLVRGDLWAEYAITYLNLVWRDEPDTESAQASKTVSQAREVVDHALALAPHDARIWLVLASVDMRFNSLNQKPAAALQMSYYTGTNETELIPLRLLLAVNSQALADKDFQQLVRHDIRIIVTRKPELEHAIVAAYRDASPLGRKFLEKTLEEIDPTLLARLASKG